jgi:hypothetical protein
MRPTKEYLDNIKQMTDEICNLKAEVSEHIAEVAFKYFKANKHMTGNGPSSEGNFSDEWVIYSHTIMCPWSDSWSYSGYDEGEVIVPLEYFYDDDLFEKYLKDCKNNDLQRQKRMEQKELADKKALYEHLKKHFEIQEG